MQTIASASASSNPDDTQPNAVANRGTSLEGRDVLIVEDDHPSAKLVAILLAGEGCSTRVVDSAEAAVVAIAAEVPDLVVLDLVLPLMSGLLFAQQLRASAPTASVPIIAVSAFNGSEAEAVALAAGCSAYVRKPIDALSFPQLVLSLLEVSDEK